MRRWLATLVVVLVACSTTRGSAGGSTDIHGPEARARVFLTLQQLPRIRSLVERAHESIEAMFDQDPYSSEGRAAIRAAQRAWRDVAVNSEPYVFLAEQKTLNRYLVPALDTLSDAADAWLMLLEELAFSAKTRIVPTRGYFENATDDAQAKEAVALEALDRALAESLRQWCAVEEGYDPACDSVSASG